MIMDFILFSLTVHGKKIAKAGDRFPAGIQKHDGLSRLSNAFCGESLLTRTGENLLKSNCVSLMKVQQSGSGKLRFRYAIVTLSAPHL